MSFFNSIPGIGHIIGAVHDIAGDHEEAREAYRAANRTTSGVLNGIPVVGHVKCVVHLVAGEEEKAKEAYLSATRSTLVLGGGMVGSLAGPGGAAALAAYTGALTDTAVSAATKKPVGFIRNIETIVEAKDVTDVIVGVGKMTLDAGLDAAAGASMGGAMDSVGQASTEQMFKSAPSQIVRSAPSQILRSVPSTHMYSLLREGGEEAVKQTSKQITKEVGIKVATNHVLKSTQKQILAKEAATIGGAICKQATKTQVVRSVTDTLTKKKTTLTKKKTQSRRICYNPKVDYYLLSSDTDEDDRKKKQYIYFFRCLDRTPTPYVDGAFKVGMSRHIKQRLYSHKYKGIINDDSYITVYECSNAVKAETQILRDKIINMVRIPNENGNLTEFLDSSRVSEEYVLYVIQNEIAEVNEMMPSVQRFQFRRINLVFYETAYEIQ